MKLFESGKVGRLCIKNRIVMAPMRTGGFIDKDGNLTQRGLDYYIARAKGGTGLIISGTTCVSQVIEYAPNVPRRLRADSNMHMTWLGKLADAVHQYGAKVAIQLTAGLGRVARPEFLKLLGAVAPSPLPCYWDPSITARELTLREIEQLIKDFQSSAERLATAGIDAIELHGHEGYLFDQFKTALWNKRTDKYGGDLERRLRFSVEVIEAVKRGAGADFPIIYRVGLTHYLAGGREIEEGLEIVPRLEAAGIDALDIDAGCYENLYWPHPPTTQPRGCMVDLAKMAKRVVGIPVIAVGKLGYPELAERVLQEGKADFISLGRPLLADPEWPNKVKEGRLEDIRPCIGCHEGCLFRSRLDKYLSCAVNPTTGMEKRYVIRSAKRKKSVLVVGGGPAGMEAARIAALRGHRVTLWERDDALGGNLIPASVPDFKEDYRIFINYLCNQMKKLGITIELGKEATPELIQKMNPDVVFIATGSKAIIPETTGVGKKKVISAIDLLLGRKEAGKSVVVIGGGLVGCETALYLARKGKNLTIVEILDRVMRDVNVVNRMHLIELLIAAHAGIMTDTEVLEIGDEGVTVASKHGKTSIIRADTVVLAIGMKPEEKLSETLKGKVPEVYTLGDCVEPRKVINAIWEGFNTARLV